MIASARTFLSGTSKASLSFVPTGGGLGTANEQASHGYRPDTRKKLQVTAMPDHEHTLWQRDARVSALLTTGLLGHVVHTL
jgi:hypothetical protein